MNEMIKTQREEIAMTNTENRPLIFERLTAVMADMKAIDKAQRNDQQRFMFRGIDDVLNGVQPFMAKHQVFVVQEIMNRERIIGENVSSYQGKETVKKFVHCIYQYRFRFYTIDGSYVDTYVDGEGIDYGDKAANKCGSIALKYALINTLLIPTKETDDPDKESHEIVRYEPAKQSGQQPAQPAAKSEPKPEAKPAEAMPPDRAFVGERMLLSFKNEFGVERKTIESFLGCKLGSVSENDIVRMRECYMRLKAGEPSNLVFRSDLTADLF